MWRPAKMTIAKEGISLVCLPRVVNRQDLETMLLRDAVPRY